MSNPSAHVVAAVREEPAQGRRREAPAGGFLAEGRGHRRQGHPNKVSKPSDNFCCVLIYSTRPPWFDWLSHFLQKEIEVLSFLCKKIPILTLALLEMLSTEVASFSILHLASVLMFSALTSLLRS